MISYVQDILEGLRYMHGRNVIHADIKPENLLMQNTDREDEFNRIKLCDFGLSQLGRWLCEAKVGTIGYIAPEMQEGKYIGPEADLWSLGVVLYELAVAYKPT